MTTAHALSIFDVWRRSIAGFAMAVSSLVLIGGWGFDADILRSLHPDFPAMKANTALALFAAGLALWLLAEDASDIRRRVGLGAALLVALIGGLTLVQYLFGWNFGIDQLLVTDTTQRSLALGRPAPSTASAFVLLGLALLCIERHTRIGDPAEWLAFGAGLIALLTLIGYAYGGQPLHKVPAYDGMALHTALVLILLAIGVLLTRPHAGLIAAVTSDSAGGYMARRLLPLALLAPPFLGWLRLLCERAGYYDPLFAVTLFATANVAVIAVIVRRSILAYHELDIECRMTLEQSRKLSNAIEQTADSVVITDREGMIEYVNPAFEAITGYSSAEALGQTPSLAKSGVHSDAFYRHLWTTILGGKEFRAAFINRRKDNSLYHEQKTITPVRDRYGQITHFVSTGKDISDEVRQQTRLRESEERFRATFEQAAVGIAHVTPEGVWLRVNQKLCDIIGYTREELLQKSFQDITHPDDLDADQLSVRAMLRGKLATFSTEKRYLRKNGSIAWINLTVSLVHDTTGAPAYFICVIEDIGERKRAEEEARLLQAITLAVSAAPDVDSALEIVLHKVSAATGWACGEAWLPCDENEHLQCASVFYAHEAGLNDVRNGSHDFRCARGEGCYHRRRLKSCCAAIRHASPGFSSDRYGEHTQCSRVARNCMSGQRSSVSARLTRVGAM